MTGRAITANTGTITTKNIVATMMAINTMAEMITGTIVDIGQSLLIITIIITMSISTNIAITVIGPRGNHGSITKKETPTMRGMVITKDITTSCFSYLMMA
jgi:hypothetical protein